MNKNEFIRKWAKNSHMSIKDAKAIWIEFEKILFECVEKREPLHLRNFGHLEYGTRKMGRHNNIMTGEIIDPQQEEVEVISFNVSRNLKDLMIEDPTKRRLYQTRQAEVRRAEMMDEENLDDIDDESDDFEDELELEE
jgi:nucleoid DNA-binding protein